MLYVEKNEKSERVYSVSCDTKGLSELLDQIVRETSYRKTGRFIVIEDDKSNGINGYKLPNGDRQYENISRVFPPITSKIDGSIGVVGTKVIAPELARIVRGLIDEDASAVGRFINYKSNPELVSIDDKITAANGELNDRKNSDYAWKTATLSKLRDLFEDRNNGHYFNAELLKQFYDVACSLVDLKLVSEKITIGDKILLKEYEVQDKKD